MSTTTMIESFITSVLAGEQPTLADRYLAGDLAGIQEDGERALALFASIYGSPAPECDPEGPTIIAA